MLRPHPSTALEYWFFKVNAGPTALLVDWIVRRQANENILRVSIHSPQGREVLFDKRPVLMGIGSNFLSAERTAGQVGDVEWELEIDDRNEWIAPDIFPARLLSMTDLALVSAPLARFSGWIRHGKHEVKLDRSPGMLSQYWGRKLAPEWWWVSASQFDQEGVAVECAVFKSGVWGRDVNLPLAYLYLRQVGLTELIVAPFGLVRVTGDPEKFEIEIRRIGGKPITLIGMGREYGDLGEGIINTLVGDLEVHVGGKVIASARGTAGLERRAPS